MVSTQDDELNQLREQRRLALQKQIEQQAANQADAEVKAQEAQRISQNLDEPFNILIFNNGLGRPEGSFSSVDEIIPILDENYNYSCNS